MEETNKNLWNFKGDAISMETMEMEVMENGVNEFEGFEENDTESVAFEAPAVTAAEAIAVAPHVKKVGDELVKGFLIGLGTGLAIGAAAWFHERNKRLAILEQLEFSTIVAEGIGKGNTKATIKKRFKEKEIDLTQVLMNNPATYTKTIMENVSKVKFMGKAERKRWHDVLKNIAALAIAWHNTAVAQSLNKTEIPEEEATEVLKEQ